MQDPAPPPRRPRLCRLFVRDLVLDARIGVYRHEQNRTQRVRINLDLTVEEPAEPAADELAAVVSYEPLVLAARAIVAEGHIKLVETLAARLAAMCLEDPRVHAVRVRVEKLDVFPDTAAVGVEIERERGL